MKKFFALLLSVILILTLVCVCACVNPKGPDDDDIGPLPDYSGGDPAKKWYVSDKPITIKVFYRDRLDYTIKNGDKSSLLQTMKVIEEKCNVKFQWETAQWQMSQANTQFTTALYSQNNSCDLYIFSYPKISSYGEIGAFYDYSKAYKTYANSLYKIVNEDTSKGYKSELTSIDGHMYVLPMFTAIKNEKQYLIRKDWLDACKSDSTLKAKITADSRFDTNRVPFDLDFTDMPETLDDFLNVCRAFKYKYGSEGFYPYVFDNGLNGMNLFESFGIDMSISDNTTFFLENGELKYGPTDSRALEFVTYMNILYKEGLIDPNYETNNSNADNAFETGKAGISFGYGTKIDRYQQRIDALSAKNPSNAGLKDADVQGFLPPKNGDNGVVQTRRQLTAISDSGAAAISVRSKYPKEILRVFDFIYSEEGSLLLNFGVQEGVAGYEGTYKMVDGQPVYTDKITAAADENGIALAPADAVRKYGMALDFPTMQDIRYENQVASEAVKSIRAKYLDIIAEPVPNLKFTAFEAESLNRKMYNLEQRYLTQLNGFIMGTIAINQSNWNKYISEMNGLELDEVIRIYNDAYDRYLQSK